MEVITSLFTEKDKPCVMALGNFDGVHLAHRCLFTHAREVADSMGLDLSVLIFTPHPAKLLFPQFPLQRLTSLQDQLAEFAQLKVDRVYQWPFTHQTAGLGGEEFVREILLPLKVKHVVIGFNYSFGAHGAGTPHRMIELGEEFGFKVSVLPAQLKKGIPISSTSIRDALQKGNVELARDLLGRPPGLRGRVVTGEQRGRLLGYPTANLMIDDDLLIPRGGAYAVWAILNGEKKSGMMNIGRKPTFHNHYSQTVEVHFFDFNEDLYGQDILVYIEDRLREEKKFSGISELTHQLAQDVKDARAVLEKTLQSPSFQVK